MATQKYKLKTFEQYEAIRYTTNADFNAMLIAWGEKIQSAADIDHLQNQIKLYTATGVAVVKFGDWIIKEPSGFFSALTNTAFTATYAKI